MLFFAARVGGVDDAGTVHAVSAHDSLYAIDRFDAIATAAIDGGGGVQCRYHGDGWTALFGLDGGGVPRACRQALAAAQQIEERSAALVDQLGRELGLHADFGLTVHVGLVVAGLIGEGERRGLSAVGAALRIAERLQRHAERRSERFAMSRAAADTAGITDTTLAWSAAAKGTPPIWSGSAARALASVPRDAS